MMVDMKQHYLAMAEYNQWMNGKIYDLCAGLSDEVRKKDLGAFFTSIHGTLNHLLLADRVWMGRFTNEPFHVTGLDQELYADFSILREEREKTDLAIIHWINGLADSELMQTLRYTGIANPAPRQLPLWFALSHFFNHQTHHRGQITTLLFQIGIDPGVTDLAALPSFQQL